MLICPYCEWPFASRNELSTHIEIKHKGALSKLLEGIQADYRNAQFDEQLDDDGDYIGDVVIHAPYDEDVDPYRNYPQNKPMKHPGS